MSITKQLNKPILAFIGGVAIAVALLFAFSPTARADGVVFFTRLGRVMSTYPANNALLIGTSTPPTQVATSTVGKLTVALNPGDRFLGMLGEGFQKAFQIASTTTTGGTATSTAEIFSIYRTGCINTIATSTATPVKLVFVTTGATSTFNGTVYWQYGACS